MTMPRSTATRAEFFAARWCNSCQATACDMVRRFAATASTTCRDALLHPQQRLSRQRATRSPGRYGPLCSPAAGLPHRCPGLAVITSRPSAHARARQPVLCRRLGVLIMVSLARISAASASMPQRHGDAWAGFFTRCGNSAPCPTTCARATITKANLSVSGHVEQLVEHHRERCGGASGGLCHAAKRRRLLPTLFPRELDTHQVMFAMGEAIATSTISRRRESLETRRCGRPDPFHHCP